jgi:uncharacterized protein (DUF433 family)
MPTLEDYFEFSETSRVIRIKGHRVGLEHVVEQYKAGKSAEEIGRHFPTLTLEQVYAAILYFLHYREEVEEYLREYQQLGRRMMAESDANPSPASLRLRELLRQRQEEKRRAGRVA